MAKIIEPSSIDEIPLKTIMKLTIHFGCSNCGWDKAQCDMHHIIPKSKGGTDSYDNLTWLCPNCHRLAHRNKLLSFITFKNQIGDFWKEFFSDRKKAMLEKIRPGAQGLININKNNSIRKAIRDEKSIEIVKELREANINFAKFGWAKSASKIVGISHQKVRSWIREFAPDLLDGAFERKKLDH